MKGSCLCGEIQYEVTELDSPIEHCACTTCRKAHAAAFSSAARVRKEHIKWLKGENRLSAFESSPGKRRCFCSNCGTHLVAEIDGVEHVMLRVATLDDDPGQKPRVLIWQSDEVPWLAYGPDIPAFDGWGEDLL